MFSRVVTFTGVKDLDGGVVFVRDQVAPLMRQQHGFRGLTASVDRSGAVLGVLSLWDSEADRDASEGALAKTREEAQDEARRLIAEAREEAERIRAEARGDAPELQRATERLRGEQQRILDVVEALRDQLGSMLETHQARTQDSDG